MTDQHFRLSLQSTYEESENVPGFVTSIQKKAGLDEDVTSNLMLLVSEAVTNAIVHGNKLDPSKQVDVVIEVKDSAIVTTVTDEGAGFEPEETSNPLSDENLLNEGGRGIFLINELSDHVEYLDGGTKIRFTLNR